MTSDIPFKKKSNFVDKNEIILKMKTSFENKSRLSLFGPPGIGKTTCATQFAHFLQENEWIVRWINADKRETINKAYELMYEEMISTNKGKLGIEETVQLVKNKLNIIENDTLIVFENVQDFKDLETFISLSAPKLKILTTCRQKPGIEEEEINFYDFIEMQPFNKEDFRSYFSKLSFLKERLTPDQVNVLIEELSNKHDHQILPQKVDLFASLIKREKFKGFEEIRKMLNDKTINEILGEILKGLEKDMTKNENHAFKILTYLEYLQTHTIAIRLIKDLIVPEQINTSIQVLLNLGLVKMNYKYKNYPSIEFHKVIQNEILDFIRSTRKGASLESFIDSVKNSIPSINHVPGLNWDLANVYLPHIDYILPLIKSNNESIITIMEQSIRYNFYIKYNLKKASGLAPKDFILFF